MMMMMKRNDILMLIMKRLMLKMRNRRGYIGRTRNWSKVGFQCFFSLKMCTFCFSANSIGQYSYQCRNPLFAHADTSLCYELIPFTRHFHPTVRLFANTLIQVCHLFSVLYLCIFRVNELNMTVMQ